MINEDESSAPVPEVGILAASSDTPLAADTAAPREECEPMVKEHESSTLSKEDTISAADANRTPPVFQLEMTVSSGTYVRSIVHDLALAVNSAAHVVTLTRTRQADFVLHPTPGASDEKRCLDWAVLDAALVKFEAGEEVAIDEDGWAAWELEVLEKWRSKPSMFAPEGA